MNTPLRHYIRLICLIIFLCSFSFSNLFAVDYFRHKYLIHSESRERNKLRLQDCLKSKKNNFKDETPSQRILYIYLNTLLDKILANNKDILDKLGRSASEFCVTTYNPETAASHGNGLITFNMSYGSFASKFTDDFYFIRVLSHEIAHDLLKHTDEDMVKKLQIYDTSSFKDNYIDINEYDFDGDLNNPEDEKIFLDKYAYKVLIDYLDISPRNPNILKLFPQDILEKTFDETETLRFSNLKKMYDEYSNLSKLREEDSKFFDFYTSQSDYIALAQKHEIEADNLGLKLYLNTGFYAEGFQDENLLYVKSSTRSSVISSGEEAIKKGTFDEFMESIKFHNPDTDIHPSMFWRYWNARIQLESYKKNNNTSLNSNVKNNLYFKIDLSKSKKLDQIKKFFSDPTNLYTSVKNKQDPRAYIIDQLFNPNPRYTKYSLEFLQPDKNDLRKLKDDNTMILRAIDIVEIGKIRDGIYNYKFMCKEFFADLDEYLPSIDEYHQSIRRAFLSESRRSFNGTLSETIKMMLQSPLFK